MPVSETKIRVSLTDNVSAGLSRINSIYNRLSNSISGSGKSLQGFNNAINGANYSQAASGLAQTDAMIRRLTYSAARYAIIYKGITGLGNLWDKTIGGAYEYSKGIETNEIGIAGILTSMTKLNGKTLQWNQAISISKNIMSGLQSEALKTAATSDELINTFRALLGPGLAGGMNIDQIQRLSVVGVNAVKSLGLPKNQIIQELRDLVQGGIRPASSTLATALGLTDADIKAAKVSSEGLYEFLIKRLEGFEQSVVHTQDTVAGRMAQIEEGLQKGVSDGSGHLYNFYSGILKDISEKIITVEKHTLDTGKSYETWKINGQFVQGVEKVSDKAVQISKDVGDVGKMLAPFAGGALQATLTLVDQVTDHTKILIGILALRTVGKLPADILNIATHSRDGYQSVTLLGRALQGLSDKIMGRANVVQATESVIDKAYKQEQANINIIIEQQKQLEAAQRMRSRVDTFAHSSKTIGWQAAGTRYLILKLQQLGVEEDRIYQLAQRYISLLKRGHEDAAKAVSEQIIKDETYIKTLKEKGEAQATFSQRMQQSAERVGAFSMKLGGAAIAVGMLGNIVATATDNQDGFVSKLADGCTTVGMFSLGIGTLITSLGDLIGPLGKAIKALKELGMARLFATLGPIGIAAGVATLAAYKGYSDWDDYENNNKPVGRYGPDGQYYEVRNVTNDEKLFKQLEKDDKDKQEWYKEQSKIDYTKLSEKNPKGTDESDKKAKTNNYVDAMRAQIGLTPYKLYQAGQYIGTGCMFAVSNALKSAGAPQGLFKGNGSLNVESFGKNAQAMGLLHANDGSYTPKAGDIAIYGNDMHHAAMVTESGGTIQNGKHGGPDGGVYESANSPESMGNVAYYVSTGQFSNQGTKGISGVFNQMTAFYQKYEEIAAKIQTDIANIGSETAQANGNLSAFDKVMADAKAKAEAYNKDIARAQGMGVDTSALEEKINQYLEAMHQKAIEAQQDEENKKYQMAIDSAQRIAELGYGTIEDERNTLKARLENYREFLQNVLSDTSINAERRAQYEQKLADVIKQINQNSGYDLKTMWNAVYDEMSQRQINYKDSVMNVIDNLENAGVEFLTSTESISDRFKNLFTDLANSIVKEISRIIIKMAVANAMMRIFGGGGSKTIVGNFNSPWNGGLNSYLYTGSYGGGKATGGSVRGGTTYLVGENGPELFTASQNGYIHNNRDTSRMLNRNPQVNITVNNHTGTAMKARQESRQSSDGRWYHAVILDTVRDGLYTNEGGLRDAVAGVAGGR